METEKMVEEENTRDKKVGRRMRKRGEGKQIQSLKCIKEWHRGQSQKSMTTRTN